MKIRGWGWLAGAALFGVVIGCDLLTGVSYIKSPAYRDTDPDMFWFGIGFAGLFVVMMLFAFFFAQAGDGWNDDG